MSYRSKNILLAKQRCKAFTLVEVIAAATIIGIIASSIMVVFIRCTSAVRDSARRIQALEVARENMEILLGKETVSEQVVYGHSDKYPSIQWINRVETFYEPVAQKMWLRAVCSAQYEDSGGETKSVEFTHWLTELNDKQVQQILGARQKLKDLADQLGLNIPAELSTAQHPQERQEKHPAVEIPENLSEMTPEEFKKWLEEHLKQP
jgi:prepilin-type N-terminal cleavage/methylation domain-containing protein